MPSIYAPADAVNRKLRELYARDTSAVNRKLREVWARDSAGTNRKIFSGADCQGTNYFSGHGIKADGSIGVSNLTLTSGRHHIFLLHFEEAQSYTSGQSFVTFDNLLCYGRTSGEIALLFMFSVGSNSIVAQNVMQTSAATVSYKATLTGASTDFYFDIQVGGDVVCVFSCSGLTICGKRIQNVELI